MDNSPLTPIATIIASAISASASLLGVWLNRPRPTATPGSVAKTDTGAALTPRQRPKGLWPAVIAYLGLGLGLTGFILSIYSFSTYRKTFDAQLKVLSDVDRFSKGQYETQWYLDSGKDVRQFTHRIKFPSPTPFSEPPT